MCNDLIMKTKSLGMRRVSFKSSNSLKPDSSTAVDLYSQTILRRTKKQIL